jgi:hypothetical protein
MPAYYSPALQGLPFLLKKATVLVSLVLLAGVILTDAGIAGKYL